MPIRCLTAGRMTMTAALLHRTTSTAATPDFDEYGDWVDSQDALTGQVIKVWKPFPNLPSTPDIDESTTYANIPCVARGIVDGGIRVAGTTERFGDSYENIDFVKMWVPAGIKISKRDRVTNLRDPKGNILWRDEEFADLEEVARASVFNVNGVTPLLDAFNRHVESFVLLENVTVAQDAAL